MAGGHDRRQRRAQVVRDGTQQRRLDVVAAPQRLGLDRLGLHRVAAQGDCDKRAQDRRDLRAQALGGVAREPARSEQGRHLEPPAVAQGERPSPLVAVAGTELDRGRGHGERLGDPPRRGAQRLARLGAREQLPGQAGGEIGLASPALGLECAAPGDLGHRAGHRGHDRERRQRHPVAAVGDREAADRGEVEEVERGGAQQRADDAEAEAPIRGHEQHRRQVDDAQRDDRSDELERVDGRPSQPPPRQRLRPGPRRRRGARPGAVQPRLGQAWA